MNASFEYSRFYFLIYPITLFIRIEFMYRHRCNILPTIIIQSLWPMDVVHFRFTFWFQANLTDLHSNAHIPNKKTSNDGFIVCFTFLYSQRPVDDCMFG